MSARGNVGTPVVLVHGLRTLDQTGWVTGQAAADWTPAAPAGRYGLFFNTGSTFAASALAVTIIEIGTDGYYEFQFTPDAEGRYRFRALAPAGDLAEMEFDIEVLGIGVSTAGARDLTTLDRVKRRIWEGIEGGIPTRFDTLLGTLITEVSESMQDDLCRTIPEATYTFYLDGLGSSSLQMPQGPLVSIVSVNEVEYIDDGAGGRGETLTLIEPYTYILRNLRTEGSRAFGRLEMLGGKWTPGQRNYKIMSAVCGFSPLPDALAKHAAREVTGIFLTREAAGLASKILETGEMSLASPRANADERSRALAPFRDLSMAV